SSRRSSVTRAAADLTDSRVMLRQWQTLFYEERYSQTSVCHWRTMPRLPLLMTATLMGAPSIAHVASSWLVIWKQPSPSIDHTSASGRPNWAPMAAGTAYPIVPRPPELSQVRGFS